MIIVEAPATAECGATVETTVEWSELSKPPRSLIVELVAVVDRSGDVDEVHTVELSIPISGTAGRAVVPVPVPRHGPITYDGALFSVRWQVAATVDLPRARDVGGEDDIELVVLPQGSGARWRLETAPPPS